MRKILMAVCAFALCMLMLLPVQVYAEDAESEAFTVYPAGVRGVGVVNDYAAVMGLLKKADPETYEKIDSYVGALTQDMMESDVGLLTKIGTFGDQHRELIAVCLLGIALVASVLGRILWRKKMGATTNRQLKASQDASDNAARVANEAEQRMSEERERYKAEMDELRMKHEDELKEQREQFEKALESVMAVCRSCVDEVTDVVNSDEARWARVLSTGKATAEVLGAIAGELKIPQRRKDEICTAVKRMEEAQHDKSIEVPAGSSGEC